MQTQKRKTKIGIIGCGKISSIYFEAGQKFDAIECIACADLDLSRAEASAVKYNVPHALSVDDLLAFDEVEIVVNLTIPAAHAEVGLAALRAGKSVYMKTLLSTP